VVLRALETNPDVVFSELCDGGVLFDLGTKQYFELNSAGLVVWRLIDAGVPVEAIESHLAARYGPAIGQDPFGLAAFSEALVAHALVTESTTTNASEPQITEWPAEWAQPAVTPHGRPLAEVILSPFDPTEPVPE